MSKRLKPTGFIAVCQCANIVGALDYERTERKEAGMLLGKWLHDGCSVHPQFGSGWTAQITSCKCDGDS